MTSKPDAGPCARAPAWPLAAVVLTCLAISAQFLPCEGSGSSLVGYYTSWSVYARDYHVPDIPAEKLDVINYAFANIGDGEIELGDPYADIDKFYPGDSWDPDSLRGSFHRLQILKAEHPHVRTLISVGGWTWSTYFSDVALTPQSRALFASSCVQFIEEYGFDGVDIDWEYPVSGGLPGNVYRPEDKQNFTLLLAELRSQLDAAGDYLLTIAASASPFTMDNTEVDQVHQYLDWINVMTYDFHGPWGGDGDVVTNFNSALHVAPDDPLPEPLHSSLNAEAAIQAYLDRGVPPEKLHLGVAFYGKGYGNVADVNDGLFAPYSGASSEGTWESGTFDYWDLEESYVDLNGYTSHWHEDAAVPWLYSPAAQVMISYDDTTSVTLKGDFAVASNLGGAMFWELSADRDGVLLDALHGALSDSTMSGVAGELGPGDALLSACRPNPFMHETNVSFELSRPSNAVLEVYDIAGRRVKTLLRTDGPAGSHTALWDGTDETGNRVAQGVYLLRLTVSGRAGTRKAVLLR